MLDVAPANRRSGATDGPPQDFQQHLAALEAQGLVTRIDRPIDKDTELHPLVRWQFQGGLAEDERRAFLFTHVVDAAGRRYDMPVVVGALGASPKIYSVGMGRPVEEIETAWTNAIAHPIAPVRIASPPCQGRSRRRASMPRPISRRRSASPAIRRPASATWAPTGPG